ncbi:MazG-like family protein [Bacillus sp. JCM 19041]|uniref:MazG nucleotide pyrophosphohydrolase domain-containing protein n=1 Tax=Bacillus sp. JCM 19041 TaxID=1460637 RepID=UPI0006D0704C
MKTKEFQSWVAEYYQLRGWSDLNIFIRIGFLSEETGEVARAIRALEIGRDRPDEEQGTYLQKKEALSEELGDVLGNIAVIANKYGIEMEDAFAQHKEKLSKRFEQA